jgi:SAM-dependent methyltransferase
MDVRTYNRRAWDRKVDHRDKWTIPASAAVIEEARRDRWQIQLTAVKPVPRTWFPPLAGREVLCLASGGGQQGPILAAAGAKVTVLDSSPKQLAQDRLVAERDSLDLVTVSGDMAELSMFGDQSFDLVVHPAANMFVPDIRPVWREAFRVLRRGGALLSGFFNPTIFIFHPPAADAGRLEVRHQLPYSDLTSLTVAERQGYLDREEPLIFGHTLEDQIGGQLDAGFILAGFYEDSYPDSVINNFMPAMIATRAVKP